MLSLRGRFLESVQAPGAVPGCDQIPGSPQRSPVGAAELPCPWVVTPPAHGEGEEPPPMANTDSKQPPHPNPTPPARFPWNFQLKGPFSFVSRANQSDAVTLCADGTQHRGLFLLHLSGNGF